ncbi:hypothetical protein, partial [Nocardia farcinica]|uniref:hypothetical protein n=2 Tax=Nocardia TaxID=1817 RepID=UPI002455E09D
MRRPRALVLDEVWRGIDGVEALSGPHGGPLRRTVKLILDPLVIRPVQHPACAGPVLTEDGATLLAARVHAAADRLRATAAWFGLLKQTRRALRITEGNAQDLYFQRCFELAVTRGHPDPERDRPRAEATLREIHEVSGGRTTQALKDHLAEPATAARLAALIDTAWARRPGPVTAPAHDDLLRALLDAAACEHLGIQTQASATGNTRPPSAAELFDAAVSANVGTHTGITLWYSAFGTVREATAGTGAAASAHTAPESDTISAKGLGLTAHPLPPRPEVGTSAATATLRLPFDRTIHERVFTVLQASTERAELPPIPDLVTEEIARSSAPLALLDETLRATAAAGVALATGLAPLDRPATALAREDADESAAHRTAAHRTVDARWRREAY